MGSTPLGYCWFIYKIGARTGRLTGQFETYARFNSSNPGMRVTTALPSLGYES